MLLSRAPLTPKDAFDLHVLGTPPAFVLSQDQTLHSVVEPAPKRLSPPLTGFRVIWLSRFSCEGAEAIKISPLFRAAFLRFVLRISLGGVDVFRNEVYISTWLSPCQIEFSFTGRKIFRPSH